MAPPLGFIIKLESLSVDKSNPFGMRLFGSSFLLMIFTSLRFANTVEVGEIWRSKTAICGHSLDQKKPRAPSYPAGVCPERHAFERCLGEPSPRILGEIQTGRSGFI